MSASPRIFFFAQLAAREQEKIAATMARIPPRKESRNFRLGPFVRGHSRSPIRRGLTPKAAESGFRGRQKKGCRAGLVLTTPMGFFSKPARSESSGMNAAAKSKLIKGESGAWEVVIGARGPCPGHLEREALFPAPRPPSAASRIRTSHSSMPRWPGMLPVINRYLRRGRR